MHKVSISRKGWRVGLAVTAMLSILVVLLVVMADRESYSSRLDVAVVVEPYSLTQYDDFAGHRPFGAIVQITNLAKRNVWFYGSQYYTIEQMIEGEWQTRVASVEVAQPEGESERWRPLRTMESKTIIVGPVSEKATELRVGFLFATERNGLPFRAERVARREAHWVFCPTVKIVKKGEGHFPEAKPGARQEEALPLK